jgi:NAD(P)-dependent dehydrogenase (short-subunit alcohol dehydrogenase family)
MIDHLFDVKDRVIIITGGLGKLGRQFALALLERGARVAVFDIDTNDDRIAEVFGEKKDEGNIHFLHVDTSQRTSLEAGLAEVIHRWGVPTGLINNAALDSPPSAPAEENGPFETYPESSWDKVMEVNTKGVFLCCQVVGGQMADAGQGSVINICSTYGLVSPDQRIYEYRAHEGSPFFKPAAYSVSKSALLNLTRYLATYWAAKNVRVNTLTFGGVFDNQDRKFLKGYCERVPMGRMAEEDEYNGAVIFLLSDASSYMTGSNLIMDGGWTAW